jgi:hypothetical protein
VPTTPPVRFLRVPAVVPPVFVRVPEPDPVFRRLRLPVPKPGSVPVPVFRRVPLPDFDPVPVFRRVLLPDVEPVRFRGWVVPPELPVRRLVRVGDEFPVLRRCVPEPVRWGTRFRLEPPFLEESLLLEVRRPDGDEPLRCFVFVREPLPDRGTNFFRREPEFDGLEVGRVVFVRGCVVGGFSRRLRRLESFCPSAMPSLPVISSPIAASARLNFHEMLIVRGSP